MLGAAMEVYNTIGGGLLEEVYHECMELELTERSIPFSSKMKLEISYKGHVLNKHYFPDYVTHNRIIVELKSVANLDGAHEAQLMNYMRLSGLSVGYLINFGNTEDLQWKRFIL